MLDIKFVRSNTDDVKEGLRKRRSKLDLDEFLAIDQKRRDLLLEAEELKARRNQASGDIARMKKTGENADALLAELGAMSTRIKALDEELKDIDGQTEQWVMSIPNVPHPSVPEGVDDSDNVQVRTWGAKPELDFAPKEHWELGTALGGLDFETAAKITGSRFVLLKGWAARMERALISLMLDVQTMENGYDEVMPPVIVNRESLMGTGQLPKFEEDLFRLGDSNYYLIPTAEVPVTNIYRDTTLAEGQLPIAHCAYTACFRSEAGSYGKDTKGMIRQHQFDKVELVRFVHPDSSYDELEKLLGQDLRHRGLAARPGQVPRDLVLLQFRGFPGPQGGNPLQAGRFQEKPSGAYPEWLGAGRGADHGRPPGELPAGRRFGHRS